MNIWQRIMHRLFGFQYVMIPTSGQDFEVIRARNTHGVFVCQLQRGKLILTKERMAKTPVDFLVGLSAARTRGFEGWPLQYTWVPLTSELAAHTAMLPDEDDYRPKIETHGSGKTKVVAQSLTGSVIGHTHVPFQSIDNMRIADDGNQQLVRQHLRAISRMQEQG